jgi:cell shape-determining protein MreC
MSKFNDRLATAGIYVTDPTKTVNITPGSTTDGLFSQINSTGNTYLGNAPFNDPWENPMKEIEERIKKLETDNKFLRLKILSMEGKFTQEEVINIRKMLIAEDESSRTLAESIIENA